MVFLSPDLVEGLVDWPWIDAVEGFVEFILKWRAPC